MALTSSFKLDGPRNVVKVDDPAYPEALRSVESPPRELYVVGDLEALKPGLSVVGARHATPYGIACARTFAGMAASRGVVIISGGALGCDSEAHRAALDEGGITVVVLGGGVDRIYPASNKSLFQTIVDNGGAVLSEHPWDADPLPHRFRMRNRIIGGLGAATLIVEAALPSGTFSTADYAISAGREVLAVPGSIVSKTSEGSNWLIAQGATPVLGEESFDLCLSRIFGLLRQESFSYGKLPAGMHEDPLLAALQANPMRLEQIMETLRPFVKDEASPESYLLMRLTELESFGLIERFPDGRYGPGRF